MLKILIITGELSGDTLGAELMREMILQHAFSNSSVTQEGGGAKTEVTEELIFQGIGGPLMERQGLVCLYDIKDISVMGITEVLYSLPLSLIHI